MNPGNGIPPYSIRCCKGVLVLYNILLNDLVIGHVQVGRVGLYYKFWCICKFNDNKIYRIKVSDGITEIVLGICVPEGDHFVLNTKIPVNRLQQDSLVFRAEPRNESIFTVETGKSFSCLDKLETARLQNANGQVKMIID